MNGPQSIGRNQDVDVDGESEEPMGDQRHPSDDRVVDPLVGEALADPGESVVDVIRFHEEPARFTKVLQE
ncbi:MAG TPA: hypothetical protein VNA04_06190 [Thermoanaerobaculia bacterium]|nr:hypothetical protein [Thermoanaerobaculia bacterium]